MSLRSVRLGFVTTWVAAASVAGQDFVGPPVPDELAGVALAGQVFDALGGGVDGATITLQLQTADGSKGKAVAAVLSDALGDFEVRVPPNTPGKVVLTVTKEGFAPFERAIEVSEISEDDFIEALMQGGQKLFGQVVSVEANRPVPDARLVASVGGRELRAVADIDGQFEIAGIPPGGGRLRASADGYGTESVPIDTSKRTEPMIVSLKRERVLHLTVLDEKDRPIPGVMVELIVGEGTDQRTERTEPDGTVAIRGLSQDAEKLRVRLSHDEFVKSGGFDHEIIPDPGELAPRITLSLVRGGAVAGTVTGADREPLFGARLIAGGDPNGLQPSQFTDADGKFRLSGIPRGKTVIAVYHTFHAPQLFEVMVEPGREKKLKVRMKSGEPLAGTVADPSGNGVEGVRMVSARWKGHSTLRIGAITDADGRFEFDHAPPGEIRFTLTEPGLGQLKEVGLEAGKTDYRIEVDPAAVAAADPAAPPAAGGPANLPAGPQVGDAAPAFDVTTTTGRKLTLEELKGKYVFLDFWATWCPPCVAEVPVLKRLHAATADRDDFLLLSISLDRDKGAVERFVRRQNVEWLQAVGEEGGAARTATTYQVRAIPTTYLIGPDGKVVATNLRGEGLIEQVGKHLGPKP